LWVFTGDDGDEAQIGWTCDGFQSYKVVVQNDQQSRACGAIITPQGLYFGTDAPDEQNYFYYLEPETGKLNRLHPAQQCVFFCGAALGGMFFTTVVEPSQRHTTDHVHVWFSDDGESWENVLSVQHDGWPLIYFQYPSVYVAKGPRDLDRVFLSLQGTRNSDGRCLVLGRTPANG